MVFPITNGMRFIFVGFPSTVFPEMVGVAKRLRDMGHHISHWIRASGFAPDLPQEVKSMVDFRWNYDWSDPSAYRDQLMFTSRRIAEVIGACMSSVNVRSPTSRRRRAL